MRTIYCLLLLLCPCISISQPIRVGDKVPDIQFRQIINSKAQTITLSQLKGKLVILDFWATWCGNCIKKFSLLDSMQRSYPGKLQVLLVNTADTRDTKERIERFFNRQRNNSGERYGMPVVYNDTTITTLFPHEIIPHYVWLSASHQVVAITDAGPVTAANIKRLISGQPLVLTEVNPARNADLNRPFFGVHAVHDPTSSVSSTVSDFAAGIKPAAKFSKDSNNCRYTIINMPLRDLLKTAYGISFKKDRLLPEVSDSILTKLSYSPQPFSDSVRYCYEIIAPAMPLKKLLSWMQQDMQRYFNLAIKKEMRTADCYSINTDSSLLYRFKTSGGKPVNKLYDRDKRAMINMPLAILVAWLDNTLDRKVILQTTVGFNLDLELSDTVTGDIAALQSQLAKMGIILTATTAITEQQIIYQTPKP